MHNSTPFDTEATGALERLREVQERYHAASSDSQHIRAERNRALREAHKAGVREHELAAVIGVSQPMVSKLLRGVSK